MSKRREQQIKLEKNQEYCTEKVHYAEVGNSILNMLSEAEMSFSDASMSLDYAKRHLGDFAVLKKPAL